MYEKYFHILQKNFDNYIIKIDNEDLSIIGVDLSNVFRSLSGVTYFIFLSRNLVQEISNSRSPELKLLKSFRNFIRSTNNGISLLLFANEDDKNEIYRIIKRRKYDNSFALFLYSKFFNLQGSSLTEDIRTSLLEYENGILLNKLNPYSIDKCATNKMFFGRKKLIQEILTSHNNAVIVGPRRIGKTSVSLHIANEMGVIPMEEKYILNNKINKCAFLDLSNLHKEYNIDIWEKILKAFNFDPRLYVPLSRKLRGKEVVNLYQQGLYELLNRFSGELTIILDEIDDWLVEDYKNGWKVLKTLKSFTDRDKAKIIMVGYETLNNVSSSHKFPFYGRFEKIKIKPLNRDSVKNLIKEPLKELQIKIDKKFEQDLIENIWRKSSGKPNLVQSICQEMVKVIAGEKIREINNNHYRAAIQSSSSYNSLLESVLKSGDPLALLICSVSSIICNENTKKPDTVVKKDFLNMLEYFGYEYDSGEITTALTQLDLRDIIILADKESGLYKWTNIKYISEFYNAIEQDGRTRWIKNLLSRHEAGDWNPNYFK